jgi:hypothetical protein
VFPSSWRILVKACPGLGTPAAPNDLALAVVQILPSARLMASASATTNDFGAESSRPTVSLSTLQPPSVTRREARLATGLPATALTGLDLHQLDSYERFHQLILNSPFPSLAWRDSPHFSPGFVARRRRRSWIQGARPRAPQAYSTVRVP